MDDAATVATLSTQALRERMQSLEQSYREGHPLVSDEVFDHVYCAELKRREPDHPLLQHIGVEPDFGEGKIEHPTPMLSTEKAYTVGEIEAFVARVTAAANQLGIEPVTVKYRLTPKLDGMAARFSGEVLVTRGDGLKGNDITSAIGKGVVMGDPGVGEIVMDQGYFDAHLAENFEHPRNAVVGAVAAKDVNEHFARALSAGAIRFVNYESLRQVHCVGEALIEQLDELVEVVLRGIEYKTDGVVIEVTHSEVKERLGATSHHHRWMIAKKSKGETAVTVVEGIEWETGRTGRVTPTVKIKPVRLSGATLSRVTAHHAGNVKALGIGVGASLRIIRSGSVIPAIDGMVEASDYVTIPEHCPSCGEALDWEKDFIVCNGVRCEAQLVRRLHHFFEILSNLDLFGRKTVQKLVDNGHTDLVSIYNMRETDFAQCGFGDKQSENLVRELKRSRSDAVEDWRFLGAMGIHHLGRGSSRRLLKDTPLESVIDLSAQDIEQVESFGPVVAPSVHRDLTELWPTIRGLLDIGFNLVRSNAPTEGQLAGKKLVFTGSMSKPRADMEAEARGHGAEVQKSVSGKTDWLITGGKVGASKIAKAEKLGVRIVPVADYERSLADL